MGRPRLSLRLAMGAIALAAALAALLLRPWPQPPPSQKEAIALAQTAVHYDGFARARPDGRGGWVVSFPQPGRNYGPGGPPRRPPKSQIIVLPVHVRFDRRCERYEGHNPEHHPPPPPPAVTVERGWLQRLLDRLP